MVLQTNNCCHKIISISIVFSYSNLFSLPILARACILQFKLSSVLVSLISHPCLCSYISIKFLLLFILCSVNSWLLTKFCVGSYNSFTYRVSYKLHYYTEWKAILLATFQSNFDSITVFQHLIPLCFSEACNWPIIEDWY